MARTALASRRSDDPPEIKFLRLSEIPAAQILDHMTDERVARHLPLMRTRWDIETVRAFVAAKEECWRRDGLGHWAVVIDGHYAGWGGFQLEGDDWDFGLVLHPRAFGFGVIIARKAIEFARRHELIAEVSFLLPPSRRNASLLARFGAERAGEVAIDGQLFRRYVLDLRK